MRGAAAYLSPAPDRIEEHSDAMLAYCPLSTLHHQLHGIAGGRMPRVGVGEMAIMQLLDMRVPTLDGCELLSTRQTEPDADVVLLLKQIKLESPPHPPAHGFPYLAEDARVDYVS